MAITLTPELEELVMNNASAAGFDNAEAYLQAILTQSQHELIFPVHTVDQIRADIDEGWQQSQRGELLDSDAVWSSLDQHKAEWKPERAS